MSVTARLNLPLLVPGQAQKELFHNEALQALDMIVNAVVSPGVMNNPPDNPETGSAYIVGPVPTGDWDGHGNAIACWTEGGWRYCDAFHGLQVSVAGSGISARFDGQVWCFGVIEAASIRVEGQQVVGPRQPAVPVPAGGSVVDVEARSSIAQVIKALQAHGLIATA